MHRVVRITVVVALVAGGVAALVRAGRPNRKAIRRVGDRAARRLRYLGGRWQGVSYRLRGGRPDPDVSDDILADRIRSSLGGVEKRLDLPHIHVTVRDGTAVLHGEVGTEAEATEIERAVAAVSGVVGVESHLHVGLLPGDTRPSEGRRRAPASPAHQRLVAAAVDSGVDEQDARDVVRAVLSVLVERLPAGERAQVAAHLPGDVRPLLTPPRRLGPGVRRIRTVPELVAEVAALAPPGLAPEQRQATVEAVVRAFHDLVPHEAADVAAVLPEGLRALWETVPAR